MYGVGTIIRETIRVVAGPERQYKPADSVICRSGPVYIV